MFDVRGGRTRNSSRRGLARARGGTGREIPWGLCPWDTTENGLFGVLSAVSVTSACVLEGSATEGIAVVPADGTKVLSVEHPTGEFAVQLETNCGPAGIESSAALLRTARRLLDGAILVPRSVWSGR